MKQDRSRRVCQLLCLVFTLGALLIGCGGTPKKTPEDLLADMKEFSTADKTASLYLKKDWVSVDIGMSTGMAVGREDGSEAVILLQFPKTGDYGVDSMDSLDEYLAGTYSPDKEKDVRDFEVPGLSVAKAVTCKVSFGGRPVEACMVNGETGYAYYSIAYLAFKIDDTKVDSFRASCSKFKEAS